MLTDKEFKRTPNNEDISVIGSVFQNSQAFIQLPEGSVQKAVIQLSVRVHLSVTRKDEKTKERSTFMWRYCMYTYAVPMPSEKINILSHAAFTQGAVVVPGKIFGLHQDTPGLYLPL